MEIKKFKNNEKLKLLIVPCYLYQHQNGTTGSHRQILFPVLLRHLILSNGNHKKCSCI